MTTLFISDLHLRPDDKERIELTAHFLKTATKGIESLYILGDLFNTWLGDDVVPTEFSPLIEQLQQLHNANIKTYLMVGNRDFMIGKDFAKQTACELLPDSYIIDLYGTKTLLLHGDTLCIDDISYQRFRLWSRTKLFRWIIHHLPTRYRQRISNKIKQKSSEQKQSKSSMIMDVNKSEVVAVMEQFNVTQLIHGHTHRPAIHQLKIGGQTATRIVLGDWDNEISYLKCDVQQYQLIDHRISENKLFRTGH
ncbi:MAG: UDP-2,3-diacylglucosamine diphosphatase [Methylophagaceae bacterium]